MRLDVPVTPDADTARDWAREELAKSEYADQGTNWFERFLEWVSDLFNNVDSLGGAFGSVGTIAVVLLTLAAVAVVIWLVLGPLRRSRRGHLRAGVLEDDARSSQQMRDAALTAQGLGDWDTAAMEWYRACVRRMEERGRIGDSPGATAREAANLIAAAAPALASEAALSAHYFDVARYGAGGLSEAQVAQVQATFEALAHVRSGTASRTQPGVPA